MLCFCYIKPLTKGSNKEDITLKSKKVIGLPQQSINDKVQEYYRLREEAKTIKSRMDILAKEIKDYAGVNGVKDDKGSFYCDNGTFMFGQQAKKSVTFVVDKALAFFKSNGLVDAIKTTEVIDEDAVERYINEGRITFDDLESITQTKVTYAIDLKKKEDMPVVEETTVAMAASKKPKLSVKRGN